MKLSKKKLKQFLREYKELQKLIDEQSFEQLQDLGRFRRSGDYYDFDFGIGTYTIHVNKNKEVRLLDGVEIYPSSEEITKKEVSITEVKQYLGREE